MAPIFGYCDIYVIDTSASPTGTYSLKEGPRSAAFLHPMPRMGTERYRGDQSADSMVSEPPATDPGLPQAPGRSLHMICLRFTYHIHLAVTRSILKTPVA